MVTILVGVVQIVRTTGVRIEGEISSEEKHLRQPLRFHFSVVVATFSGTKKLRTLPSPSRFVLGLPLRRHFSKTQQNENFFGNRNFAAAPRVVGMKRFFLRH